MKLSGDHRIDSRPFRAEKTMPMKTDRNPETLETGDLQIMKGTWFKKEESNM